MVIIFSSPKTQHLVPGQVSPGSGFEHEETHWLGRKMLNGIARKGKLAALAPRAIWMEKTQPCPCQLLHSGVTRLPATETLLSRAVSSGRAAGQAMAGQGKGREQRKQEGRRSCIPSLLLIILPFLLREASRSANSTLEGTWGGDQQLWVQEGDAGLGFMVISKLLYSWDKRDRILLLAQQ